MRLEEAVKYSLIKAEELNIPQLEVYAVKSYVNSIDVEKTNVTTVTRSIAGISIRAATKDNVGFSFTMTLTKEAIEETIKAALSNAKAKGKDEYFKSLPEPMESEPFERKIDENILSLNTATMIEYYDEAKSVIDSRNIKTLGGKIVSIYGEARVANTLGIDFSDRIAGLAAWIYAGSLKELPPAIGFWVQVTDKLEEFNPYSLGKRVAEETKRAMKAKTMSFSGKTTVIFEPPAVSSLMWIFEREVAADNVDRGATPFHRSQIEKQVASKMLTIIDDGRSSYNPLATIRDDEGVPTKRNKIIDNGILKLFLTDYYYARKWGVEPTGNGVRKGGMAFNTLVAEPQPSAHFLEITSDNEAPLSFLIESVNEGFLIRDIMGVHMSDFSSGKFSVPAFGWYIKNGEVKYPVRNIMISGTIPELLKKVYLVSKEKEVMWGQVPGRYSYIACSDILVSATEPSTREKFALSLINLLLKLGIYKSPIA